MGLWSSIKKGVKGVFKGVKKVFKKVGKAAGKFFRSKFGRVILIAAAVVTAGAALYAAYAQYTVTAGSFLTKFVAGAKAFVGALASPVKSVKNMFGVGAEAGAAGGQAVAAAEQVGAAGDVIAGGGAGVTAAPIDMIAGGAEANQGLMAGANSIRGLGPDLTGLAGGSGGGAGALTGAGEGWMMPQVGAESLTKGASDAGGWLSKAASGAKEFVKSTGGGIVAGQMISGYAKGKQQEELLKEEERIRRYYDYDWKNSNALNNVNYNINTPQGLLSRASQTPRAVRESQPDRGNTYQYGGGNSNYAPVGG